MESLLSLSPSGLSSIAVMLLLSSAAVAALLHRCPWWQHPLHAHLGLCVPNLRQPPLDRYSWTFQGSTLASTKGDGKLSSEPMPIADKET